jgi:23S rRNA (adenine2503-C2)-methyltransferase
VTKTDLKALSKKDVESFILEQGLAAFRAKQLLHWIYERRAESIDEITEFSKDLRESLSEKAFISNVTLLKRQAAGDGTEKFLFGLSDGESIESVVIPDKDRLTLCISSQVGCAMMCSFCLTGKLKCKRNLQAHEIVDQVISVSRLIEPKRIIPHPSISSLPPAEGEGTGKNTAPAVPEEGDRKITGIVLMGMGEPLANLDEVAEALRRMTDLMKISKRRITLSTSGISPMIPELARRAPRVNLAISLNATTDEVRNRIMPVNKRYPLKSLLDACRRFPLEPRRRITFEYVMLQGINDTRDDARRLVRILKGIPCKVNLIPFNPYAGAEFRRPSDEEVERFQKVLLEGNITALVRKSKGQDILAACGQLKAGYG